MKFLALLTNCKSWNWWECVYLPSHSIWLSFSAYLPPPTLWDTFYPFLVEYLLLNNNRIVETRICTQTRTTEDCENIQKFRSRIFSSPPRIPLHFHGWLLLSLLNNRRVTSSTTQEEKGEERTLNARMFFRRWWVGG